MGLLFSLRKILLSPMHEKDASKMSLERKNIIITFFFLLFFGGFYFSIKKKKKEGTIKMITLYLDGRDGWEKYHGMCLRFCHSIFMMMLNGMWSKLVDKRFCVQQHVSIIYHHTSPSRVRTSLFPPSRYIKSRDNDARQMVNSTQIYCSPRRPL